jgi:hypothetical protein
VDLIMVETLFRFSSFFTLGLTGDSCSNSQGCVRGPLKVNVPGVGLVNLPDAGAASAETPRACLECDGVVLAMLARAGVVVEVELG